MSDRKIKLVYIIDDLFSPCGMQRGVTIKANYLAEKLNYDVTIITTEEKKLPPYYPLSPLINYINLDINFYRMYDNNSMVLKLLKYKSYMRRYKKEVKQLLYKLHPDITISLLRKDINFITSIKDGSKKIGEIHFDKEHYRIFNGNIPQSIRNMISRLWMMQLITRLKKLDRFVVLTNEDKEKWTELNNVICIYNPVSFQNITEHSTGENKVVIAIGRYTYQKGFDLLFPAWKIVSEKHPDWKLIIYGGGDRTEYQRQVNELGINTTCILNESTPDIPEKLTQSSIFAFSSRFEGFGMVVTEAMVCGVPPVSFACPCGPRDIITDGIDGLLVENGNIQVMAEKLCLLIENENLRKQMGKQATVNVKRFYIENIMPQWDNLFKSLLS